MTNNVHKQFDWILKTVYDFIGKIYFFIDFLLQIIKWEKFYLKKTHSKI